VHRRHDDGRELRLDGHAAVLADPELTTEERLRGGRAEAHEHLRLQQRELGLEPRPAGGDLRSVRFLVDAALPTRLPLEVLDDVRDVGQPAVDPGLFERVVEQSARGADERPARQVLLVAGLLADEHDLGFGRPFAEDRLRPGLPEIARLTPRRDLSQLLQRGARGDERRRRPVGVEQPLRHGGSLPLWH